MDSAIKAGAEIIKHQTHIVEDEMSEEAKKVIPGNAKISIYEIIEECSLSIDDEFKYKEFVENLGIEYLCTPFSAKAAHLLGEMKVNAFKIGSGECNNYPLIEFISKFKKPGPAISTLIILSLFLISSAKISATSLGFRPSNFPRTKARLLDISPKLFSFGISTEKSTFFAFSDSFPFELKAKIHFKSSSLIC